MTTKQGADTKVRMRTQAGSGGSRKAMRSCLAAADVRIERRETAGILIVELPRDREMGLAISFSLTPELGARLLAQMPQIVEYVARNLDDERKQEV